MKSIIDIASVTVAVIQAVGRADFDDGSRKGNHSEPNPWALSYSENLQSPVYVVKEHF